MHFEPISQDPDLIQAIDDFTPNVLEIRELTKLQVSTAEGPARDNLRRQIREHMGEMSLRAQRLQISGPALFQVINAALDAKSRRGRPIPNRDTVRTLITDVTNASARVEAARLALAAAQDELTAAVRHHRDCDMAASAWGIKGRIK